MHCLVLTLLSVACLMPLIVLALTSFKTQTQIFDTRWSWLFMPTLDNYRSVVVDGHIDRYMLNSLKISVAATLITLMLSTKCAYAMARFRFLGRELLSYSTLILRTLPPAVLAVPVFVIWLPLIKPGLAAAAIFTFRLAWNEFILSFILTNRVTRTLPAAISNYITDTGVEWGKIMAAGLLIALPPLIFTFVAAKQIITGLTVGAVKG